MCILFIFLIVMFPYFVFLLFFFFLFLFFFFIVLFFVCFEFFIGIVLDGIIGFFLRLYNKLYVAYILFGNLF